MGETCARGFCQRDVELRIYVNDFRFEGGAVGKSREQGFFAPRQVGVGGDHSCFGDKKAGATLCKALQIDNGGLGLADQFFQRKHGAGLGSQGHILHATSKNLGSGLELKVEMVGLQQPVATVVVAF